MNTDKAKAKRSYTLGYVMASAICLSLTGFSGEYLSRNLPENHASASGVFTALGFIVLAVYFGFKAISNMLKEHS
jgi:putative Ca2+/H+ antiporter (TMEM165/GDT1 family)